MGPFSYLSVLISIILAPGDDPRSRGRRGNAASGHASPHLLGPCSLGHKPVCVFGRGVVDFLSLAYSTTVDVFPLRICPPHQPFYTWHQSSFFRPNPLRTNSWITRLTIMLII